MSLLIGLLLLGLGELAYHVDRPALGGLAILVAVVLFVASAAASIREVRG